MKIESSSASSVQDPGAAPPVETLESRLLAAPDNKRPDLEFEQLYQWLMAMEGQGEKAIYEFLRGLRGADGEAAAYPTASALKAITLQVLFRLKDEGLEKSPLYKEVSGANGLAFAMEVFVTGWMRDVFQPMADEAWEKSEW
ncbi:MULTISPECIES: hypothetical protein [Pseudomonas]|uniref:hypothetical protein n=1 Tax=Pseudomonas TaxID=286 RepID=UPI001BE8387B|nr:MULTISPECIES: hypothetical protein [Pseudomonas]MBT2339693.1 hypothetical protein [Pseudomonas fluorescens]MCD4531215.1 hypothetical protein [Pseudomonas sp. C3-2018]